MSTPLHLTKEQIEALAPILEQKGSGTLVGSVWPTGGDGWRMDVHCLPLERRASIRAACSGELKLPRPRKAKIIPMPANDEPGVTEGVEPAENHAAPLLHA